MRGDALLGVALPAPLVEVKSKETAAFGTPTVLLTAAIEVCPSASLPPVECRLAAIHRRTKREPSPARSWHHLSMIGNPLRWASARAGLLAAAFLLGCSHDIESPTVASKAVQPDLVCVEQLTTEVILSGDGFTPMPIKTLDATQLQLPHIALDRKQDLAGTSASGKADIPDDPASPAKSLVHWTSEQRMSFKVTPTLALVPGLYDVIVTNPDAHHAATFAGGLAAVPRPTLAGTAPDVLCDAEEDQTVVLTGSGILQVGATLPTVHVADKNFLATKVEGCAPVPGKHTEGDVRSCTSATFVIPKATFQPGVYDVTLTNPAPANCVSSDKIAITIVPPPTVSTVAPDLVCDAQGEQTMTLTGTGFLTNATLFPSVTVGAQTFVPKTVTGCTPVPGQLVEGALTSCTSITFVILWARLPRATTPWWSPTRSPPTASRSKW